MHHTCIKVMIIRFKFSVLKVVLSINTPVTFQRKDISHIHHLPPMHWSAQYPGLGFTQSDLLPWLPSSSAWSNVAVGHQTIIQSISKLREEAPSIYMDGIYKENKKLSNYEIRYASSAQHLKIWHIGNARRQLECNVLHSSGNTNGRIKACPWHVVIHSNTCS